jgi:hypothetical protein
MSQLRIINDSALVKLFARDKDGGRNLVSLRLTERGIFNEDQRVELSWTREGDMLFELGEGAAVVPRSMVANLHFRLGLLLKQPRAQESRYQSS